MQVIAIDPARQHPVLKVMGVEMCGKGAIGWYKGMEDDCLHCV